MAEINVQSSNKAGKFTARSLKVDMTPMVDLGFLLITFFIFSTVLHKPTAMQLILPKADGGPTLTAESKTLTVLLDKNNSAICYEGIAANGVQPHRVSLLPGDEGLRQIIFSKQKKLQSLTGTPDSMMVVIKPGMESNYRQLVAVLDEMSICAVKKHAVGAIDADDEKLLAGGGQ